MWAIRLILFFFVGLSTLAVASAAQPAQPGCMAYNAEHDVPGVGAACGAILDDPSASVDARVEALLIRSVWHYRSGRLAEAKRDIDRGLKLAPEHAKLLQLRASLHLDEGETEAAEALAKRSAEIDPNRAATFEILASIAERSGDLRTMLAYLNRAIEVRPDAAMARYNRARLLVRLARAPEALEDTSWLIAQSPDANDRAGQAWINGHFVRLHLAGLIAHADVLKAMDRFEEAEAQFANIVAHQRSAFTLTQRSEFLHGLPVGAGMKSRLQEAMADAQEAVRLDARDARAHRQYASTLEYAKRQEEALAEVDLALQYERYRVGLPPLLWARARLLRALGRQDEAIDAARSSLLTAAVAAPGYLGQRLTRLARLGYWRDPGSDQAAWMSALTDAVTACMVDEGCW